MSEVLPPAVLAFIDDMEALIARQPRRQKPAALAVPELVEAYLAVRGWDGEVRGFTLNNVERIYGLQFEGKQNLRRKLHRRQESNRDYRLSLFEALEQQGDEGLAGAKAVFLGGSFLASLDFADLAARNFPAEAEERLSAMLADARETLRFRAQEHSILSYLEKARGYRARQAPDLAPALSGPERSGLEPARQVSHQSPLDFRQDLLQQFARHVFSHAMTYPQALMAAWEHVLDREPFEDAEYEKFELAKFDFKVRQEFSRPFRRLFEEPGSYDLAIEGLAFKWPSGEPVTREELERGFQFVFMMSYTKPYEPAASWLPA